MDIEFVSTNPKITKIFQPVPAKKFLPEWFKELPSELNKPIPAPTIKNCVPVTDMMSAGYILKNTYEFDVKINDPIVESLEGIQQRIGWRCDSAEKYIDAHFHEQCPVSHSNTPTDFFKIKNDWIIRTPPGYSCLILQPFYFFEKRYKLMSAIVDTDKYDTPIVFTGYPTTLPEIEITIKPGDPLVQIIPFKRDEWQMKISEENNHSSLMHFFLTRSEMLQKARRIYKNYMHSKKKFN